jgi:hypothetical protein
MTKKKTFMGRDGYHLPNEIVDYHFWWKLVRIGVKRNRLIEKLEENGKWVLGVGEDAEVKGDKKRWEYLDVSRYEGWGLEVGSKKFLKIKWKEWWSGDRWKDLFASPFQTKVLQEVIKDETTKDEYEKLNVKMEFVFDGDKKRIISHFEKFIKELSVVDDLSEMENRTINKRQIKISIKKFPITPENTQIKYYGMLGTVTLQECKMRIIYSHPWGKDKRKNLKVFGMTKTITPEQIWELFLKRTSDKVGKNIDYHTAHEDHKGKSKDEVWDEVKDTVRKVISRGDKLLNNVCRGEFTGKYY